MYSFTSVRLGGFVFLSNLLSLGKNMQKGERF